MIETVRKRQVIYLDAKDSAVFECAYLILRSGFSEDEDEVLLREADRILAAAVGSRRRRRRLTPHRLRIMAVTAAALAFAALCAVILILLF